MIIPSCKYSFIIVPYLSGLMSDCFQVHIDGCSQNTYNPEVMVELLMEQLRLNLVSFPDLSLALGSIKMSFAGEEVEPKELVKRNSAMGINGVLRLYSRMLEEYAMRKVRRKRTEHA